MPACRCSERKRPFKRDLAQGSNERPRQWFVLRRNYSCSAFNGYRTMWSDYSDLACRVCAAHWRSKSPYVAALDNCEYWPESHPPMVVAHESL